MSDPTRSCVPVYPCPSSKSLIPNPPDRQRARAFTLIELLVVISIISILASLSVAAVSYAKKRAARAAIEAELQALETALTAYLLDEVALPGLAKVKKGDEDRNHFPELFEALCGPPRKEGGRGGPNSPYWSFKMERLLVRGEDGGFVPATMAQLRDSEIEKFYADPWGSPIEYRVNPGGGHWQKEYYLWSRGPDGINDSTDYDSLEDPASDDIGNW